MDKQIYVLTTQDFVEHPAWYFPMDESVEDETTVRPVPENTELPDGLQVIVRCEFTAADGTSYSGYVYQGREESVDYTKPGLWANTLFVTFWNGMQIPDSAYVAAVQQALGGAWPIAYRSLPFDAFAAKEGSLAGLYYLDYDGKIQCARPQA